ncbi:MAG: winged helix-turn-helix domain-containing protein [Planctomycetota bacterium]|jgi:DNA-binding MarR family transcriptional regulator
MARSKKREPPDAGPHLDIDKLIHEPARLLLLSCLYVVKSADFVFLISHTGLTKGNLVSHMDKLESAGYVAIEKTFVDRTPRTLYRMTPAGRSSFRSYRKNLMKILEAIPE